MTNKIKILLSTDSVILSSGLSETARNIFIPLLKLYPGKYEIHQIGFFHHNPNAPTPWPVYQTKMIQTPNGIEIDPNDNYGQQSFDHICTQVKPDIVFGYGDMWHFNHILKSPIRNTYRACIYYTIDGQPYFGHVNEDDSTSWGKELERADQLITLSHFGKEVLKCNKELENVDIKVRYHPLEMARYPNRSKEEIEEIRDRIFPPSIPKTAFIVGWCGRNQFRKQNYHLWEVLHYMTKGDYIECKDCGRITIKEWNHSSRASKDPSILGELNALRMYDKDYSYKECWHCKSKNIEEGKPLDDFYMWFHMCKNDPGYNCELHERIWDVKDNCIFTNGISNINSVTKEDLAALFSSWDCMFYPSGGEGYGNPAAEVLASGTPVVYSDYSSHAEFCKFGGLPVRVSYIPELHHGIMRAKIDVNHAVEQLLKLYRNKNLVQELGLRGRMHMAQFDLKHMAPAWDSIFTQMMQKPLPVDSNVLYGSTV